MKTISFSSSTDDIDEEEKKLIFVMMSNMKISSLRLTSNSFSLSRVFFWEWNIIAKIYICKTRFTVI